MQFVSPAYVKLHNDSSLNKKLNIYLIKPGLDDKTNYIKMFYRCFLTIGKIKILNLSYEISFIHYFSMRIKNKANSLERMVTYKIILNIYHPCFLKK